MFGKIFGFSLAVGLLACNAAFAAPEAPKQAAMCGGCHGAKGISASGAFPNLAGQKADYLAAQLKAFREKTRANPVMGPMAAGLSDPDIAALAAYFSALKPCE